MAPDNFMTAVGFIEGEKKWQGNATKVQASIKIVRCRFCSRTLAEAKNWIDQPSTMFSFCSSDCFEEFLELFLEDATQKLNYEFFKFKEPKPKSAENHYLKDFLNALNSQYSSIYAQTQQRGQSNLGKLPSGFRN